MADLLTRYKDTITPTKRSAEVETYIIGAFLAHGLAGLSLRQLSASIVAQYRDKRLKKVKPGTVRQELGVLQHCFEVARSEWGIPLALNPVSQIAMPQASKPRNKRPTPEEIETLLAGCGRGRSLLMAPIIRFAIETAMRRGEIVAVRWAEVDAQRKILHIPVTKNGHPQTIPLTPTALEILAALPSDNDLVFPVSGNAIRLAWQRL